jgi:putative endonuclease
MSYFVYVLKSIGRNYTYVGMANNLEERLKRHNFGRVESTKPYKPFDLVYSEECADGKSARQREKYLKSGAGKDYLRAVLK